MHIHSPWIQFTAFGVHSVCEVDTFGGHTHRQVWHVVVMNQLVVSNLLFGPTPEMGLGKPS